MIEFNKYYRYNAVLKKAQLISPPIIDLATTGLPFWTALHYANTTKDALGLTQNHPTVRGLGRSDKVVVLFNKPNPEIVPGKVIMRAVRLNEVISRYMRSTPGWHRGDLEISLLKLKDSLVVYNYGIYHEATTFQEGTFSRHHELMGFWKQIVSQIKTNLNTPAPRNGNNGVSNRNQLIIMNVPEIIPSLKLLNNYAANEDNIGHVNALGDHDRVIIGEIWKWLSGSGTSVFSEFTEAETKKIDLLFIRAGSGAMINLYVLKKMAKDVKALKGKDKPAEIFVGQDIGVLPMTSLQRSFLAFLVMFKTKVDSGIVGLAATDEDLNVATIDETDLDGREKALLDEDENDAPDENELTKKFLSDTTEETGLGETKLEKRLRSKVSERLKAKAVNPNGELEDIFGESGIDSTEVIEQQINEVLDDLDDQNTPENLEEENTDPDPDFSNPATAEDTEGESAIDVAFKNKSYKDYQTQSQDPEESFMRLVQEEADKGNLSAAEVRRFEALSKKYRTTIKDPYGGEGTLSSAATIKPEDLLIPENNKLAEKIPGVLDQSYLESSHDRMHRHYNSNILRKDILGNSVQLMKAGYAIDSYDVTTVNDVVDSYEVHTVRFVPIRGKPSTIKFRVPIVSPNGTFKAGGNTNRMRVQRADIPIRKVSPGEVALTSYHSKMWVRRSPLVAFNFDKWVEKTITAAATDPEKVIITNVSYGNCFNNNIVAPLMYSAISRYFSSFRIGKYQFMWDSSKNDTFFGKEVNEVAKRYSKDQVMVGKGEESILWMDNSGMIFEAPMSQNAATPIGTIPDLLGIQANKIPVQSADLKIFSKSIPMGIALSFWIGLGNLLKTIKAKFRRVPARSPLVLQDNEFFVKFKDETLVFDRNDEMTSLIMSGWNEYHAYIKFYSVYDFDKTDTFGRFFYETKIEGRYENELTIIRQLWIDPITEGELIRLKEPTDMVNLFLSAVKKLTYDKHPDPMDGLFQRDRGYERISGFVYDNMVRSVRGHRNRRFMRDAALDMPPEVVWYDILKDQTTGIAEFSNPIHSLKEQEVVVFRGAGGRSSQSMMASNRKAHRSNVGRDSEATVDSGDVATVIYTTANPNYDSVRGTVRYTEKPNENISRSFGTSHLLAAGAEYDDPPRRNFISIQNSRTTNSVGSTPLPVRTGYERVLAYRQDDIYATVARQAGKVVAKTNKVIIVEYVDGSRQEIEIGLRYGEWSGKTMPHNVITDLKVGSDFTEGTPIAWGENFFSKDSLTGGLIYKPGVLGRVVLIDDEDTWEDSCAIHSNFAKKLTTTRVDKRDIVVEATQEIRNLLTVGSEVDMESILCTIFNPSEGNKDIFSQDSLDSLRDFTANSPQAKAKGTITDIEVYYTGQVEDMSGTLQDIVEASNARLYKLNKSLKKPALDGRVDVGTRFSGTVLNTDMILIRVRILTSEEMDIGSKLVFCHQMKSVLGRKIVDRLETENGEPIDAKFSNTSFSNRIVDSGNLVGTTSVLCVAATKAFIAAYRGNKK